MDATAVDLEHLICRCRFTTHVPIEEHGTVRGQESNAVTRARILTLAKLPHAIVTVEALLAALVMLLTQRVGEGGEELGGADIAHFARDKLTEYAIDVVLARIQYLRMTRPI